MESSSSETWENRNLVVQALMAHHPHELSILPNEQESATWVTNCGGIGGRKGRYGGGYGEDVSWIFTFLVSSGFENTQKLEKTPGFVKNPGTLKGLTPK